MVRRVLTRRFPYRVFFIVRLDAIIEVRAYGCIRCQHLQLAISFSAEDLRRYQQFEGQQPGVLERINSEPSGSEE